MSSQLDENGFCEHSAVFSAEEVQVLRDEADRVAIAEGSVCVRGIVDRSELFQGLSVSEALMSLLPKGFHPVRSILFDKTPEQNWPVLWHQDLTIAVADKKDVPGYGPWSFKDGAHHTQPPATLLKRMKTIRLHLDDTDEDNGALLVIPQSHLLGKIPHTDISQHTEGKGHVCRFLSGDVLVMSPLLLHSSRRSRSGNRRRVLHLEYAPPEALHPDLNWHERIRL